MSNLNKNQSEASKEGNELHQLVCFRLANETFGLDIDKVQEINRMVTITKIPQSPYYIEGVVNLRGKIIPIVDLRKKFELKNIKDYQKETRIIVVDTGGNIVGYIVDEVTEVLRINSAEINETPDIVKTNVDAKYIAGVTTINKDELLIVLNIDLLFSSSDASGLKQ